MTRFGITSITEHPSHRDAKLEFQDGEPQWVAVHRRQIRLGESVASILARRGFRLSGAVGEGDGASCEGNIAEPARIRPMCIEGWLWLSLAITRQVESARLESSTAI